MLSEIFYTFFITSIIGCLLKLTSYIYKSKCSAFSCCGLNIIRNVEQEEKLDELELQKKNTLSDKE